MAPVSNGKKTWPLRTSPFRGPMRHWHTVGLDIPCQVARLQSLTPLLQANVDFTRASKATQPTRRFRGQGSTGFRSRSRAGLRLHPEVRHGALRRRWCEWEQPHTLSWRSATADDAEWMSGKFRARLAPVLTEASSWMSDRRARGTVVPTGPNSFLSGEMNAQAEG